MVGKKPRVLILTGDGINCENETALAFNLVGAETKIIHINDLLNGPTELALYDGLALPGGFSFGDELGSGQVLALKLNLIMKNELHKFMAEEKPIIGICNGFQALVKTGLLPFAERTADKLTLAANESGQFINKWVKLKVPKNKCLWLKGIEQMILPIRHGEGRICLANEQIGKKLSNDGLIAMQYEENENGSFANIAGLTNANGNVLGLMPHPEAYHQKILNPYTRSIDDYPLGLKIFENAFDYMQRKLNEH